MSAQQSREDVALSCDSPRSSVADIRQRAEEALARAKALDHDDGCARRNYDEDVWGAMRSIDEGDDEDWPACNCHRASTIADVQALAAAVLRLTGEEMRARLRKYMRHSACLGAQACPPDALCPACVRRIDDMLALIREVANAR